MTPQIATVGTGIRVIITALPAAVFAIARGRPISGNPRDILCGGPISLYTVIDMTMPSASANAQETGSDGTVV
jgi:hypothetical protein